MRTQAKPLDIGGGRAMRLGFAVKVLGGGGLPSHDIRMNRMATALAPYASHPDLRPR